MSAKKEDNLFRSYGISQYRLALTLTLGLSVAANFSVPTAASAQESKPCAATTRTPCPEGQALQLAIDVYAAGSSGSDHLLGAGGSVRVGEIFPVMGTLLIPELGLEIFSFGGDEPTHVLGGFAGGRLRFGTGIVPGFFGHLGVAGVRGRDDFATPTADVGASVDLTYLPKILFSIQGGYKSTIPTGDHPALHWAFGGASMGFRI